MDGMSYLPKDGFQGSKSETAPRTWHLVLITFAVVAVVFATMIGLCLAGVPISPIPDLTSGSLAAW